jgi:hypothetical protein
MTDLEREFLAKLAGQPLPAASVAELNEGLCPKWQRDAAEALAAAGLVEPVGRDAGGNPRFAATDAGWSALARPAPPSAPPAVRPVNRLRTPDRYRRRYGT